MKGFREFEFDLPAALLKRLVQLFTEMDAAALTIDTVREIPDQQGVYLLLHKGVPVYVGKTDGGAGLRQRLGRHCGNIQHRKGLNPADVQFKAIRIYVFTVIDLETDLISEFNGTAWNNSGFGSNDPGRERDTTRLKEDGFDALFPIDIDREVEASLPRGDVSAAEILEALKLAVPYTFRFERNALLKSIRVHVPSTAKTTRAIVEAVIKGLPAGWQAWALPGRVIIYKEQRSYDAGALISRS